VPLLFGDRPLWRELRAGVDDGPDIQQLEANLVALGIVTESELTVDQEWTDATTEAVEDWQTSMGWDDTGVVAPADVVFLPGAMRVAEHPVAVGGQVGESAIGVTGATHVVTIDLEATRQSLVQPGQKVDIVLPNGTTTTGTIYSVGNVASADDSGDSGSEGGADGGDGGGGDSEPTIEVVASLDDPAASGSLDGAPVTVRVVTSAAENVLAVPVEALLALAEGGYAVELVRDNGTTSLVAVELGAFADGWVEVTGDVAEGDEVVIPSD
jgi:Putative peptidoglycan binding domain